MPRLAGRTENDLLVALGATEIHGAGNGCEDRMILADAHTGSGVPGCATLADDNVAGDDVFATEAFYTKTATCGIATVAG